MTHILDVWFGETRAGALNQDNGGALGFATPEDFCGHKQRLV